MKKDLPKETKKFKVFFNENSCTEFIGEDKNHLVLSN